MTAGQAPDEGAVCKSSSVRKTSSVAFAKSNLYKCRLNLSETGQAQGPETREVLLPDGQLFAGEEH